MQVFKIKFVAPYAEQLQRFAADQTLREAMTGFALGSGTDAAIAPQHRAGQPLAWCCALEYLVSALLSDGKMLLRPFALVWFAPCLVLSRVLHAMHKPVFTAYQSDDVLKMTVEMCGRKSSVAQPVKPPRNALC